MKDFLKYTSVISLFIFLVLWVLDVFVKPEEYQEILSYKYIFVAIYLFADLQYHKRLLREQKNLIQELQLKQRKE